MRSFEGKLEDMTNAIRDGLDRMGQKMDTNEATLVEVEKRLTELEKKKQAEAKTKARWLEIAQKVAIYVATAAAGWLGKTFFGV